METTKQSIFISMHNGTRTNEGSFNVGLKELFYKAGNSNRHKLVKAFPEFFGDSVPEFNIYPKEKGKTDIQSDIDVTSEMETISLLMEQHQIKWFIVTDRLGETITIKADNMAQTPICHIATPGGRWMNNKSWYDNAQKKAKKIQLLPSIINASLKLFEQEDKIRYSSDQLHDLKTNKAFIDLKALIQIALS